MKKHILITGSTDGIGKLAAINLAKEGHFIYIHGRHPEKTAAVIAEIKEVSKNQNIKGFVADFSDLAAVRQMAQQINADVDVPKIDVLINNAGVLKSPMSHNDDGIDLRFAVNYLAPYLLTKELMPLLKRGVTPRVINLSSAAQAPVSQEVLLGEVTQPANATYAQSKLALTMWSFHLAKTTPDIAVIAVNPGSLLNTNMVKESYGYHWSPADKGANILYELAVSNDYEGVTEKYFDNDQETFGKAHVDAYDQAKIDQLIKVTEGLLS